MSDDEINEAILDIFEEWSLGQGGKRVLGRIYAVLWLEEGPMEIREIKEASDYSLTTIRSTLGVLERHHFVKRVKIAHEKKLFYECCKDMTQNFQNSMQNTLNQNLRATLGRIGSLKKRAENLKNEKRTKNVKEIETEFERLGEYVERLLEVELPEKKG
ncbi:MAG: hypothetical protein KAU14_07860 [Thermoplasmata archaeon]|nr:hypothetical protein [Thermoplasmata archaeon]